MAKGITHSCANVWRGVAQAGGWWSVARIASDWDGVYAAEEVAEHVATLKRGGFLQEAESRRHGALYAYTIGCHQLPGETLTPVTAEACHTEDNASIVPPPQHDVMHTFYKPSHPTYRPDAMDHQACPSLHMGKRRAFRGEAA